MGAAKEGRAQGGGFLGRLFSRSPRQDPTFDPNSPEAIHAWIADRLGKLLNVPASQIDPAKNFSEFGLDSIEAIRLSGELEDLLGRELPPTLLWDHPTIGDLVAYLARPTEASSREP